MFEVAVTSGLWQTQSHRLPLKRKGRRLQTELSVSASAGREWSAFVVPLQNEGSRGTVTVNTFSGGSWNIH